VGVQSTGDSGFLDRRFEHATDHICWRERHIQWNTDFDRRIQQLGWFELYCREFEPAGSMHAESEQSDANSNWCAVHRGGEFRHCRQFEFQCSRFGHRSEWDNAYGCSHFKCGEFEHLAAQSKFGGCPRGWNLCGSKFPSQRAGNVRSKRYSELQLLTDHHRSNLRVYASNFYSHVGGAG